MFKLLLLLWLGCIVEGNGSAELYEIKYFTTDNKVPVYIQEIDKIQLFTDTWTFYTHIDMSYYEAEKSNVQKIVKDMDDLCTWLESNALSEYKTIQQPTMECDPNVQEMKDIVNGMKEFEWKAITMPAKGDNIIKDDKRKIFETHIKEQVEMKKANEIFVEQRLTFIKQNWKLFQNNDVDTDRQKLYYKTKDSYIRRIVGLGKVKDQYTQASRIKNSIQDLTSYAALIVTSFQAKHDAIATVFRRLKSEESIGDQMELPSATLLQELLVVKNFLRDSHTDLPYHFNAESLQQFYDIAIMDTMLLDNFFIIMYKVPVVQSRDFTLFRLSAYPRILEEGMYELLLPDVNLIAVNEDFKNYIMLDDHDLQKSYRKKDDFLLCELTEPILSTKSSGSCAIDLLTAQDVSKNCDYRITQINNEFWLQLGLTNSWLFVFPNPAPVTIECNGDVDVKYLDGSGTLSIQPGCSASTSNVNIVASSNLIHRAPTNVPIASKTTINWTDALKGVSVALLDIIRGTSLPRVIEESEKKSLHEHSTRIKFIKFLIPRASSHQSPQQPTEYIEITVYTTSATVILALIIKTIFFLKRLCQRSTREAVMVQDNFELI